MSKGLIPLDPKRDQPRPGYDNTPRNPEPRPQPKPGKAPAEDRDSWAQRVLDGILKKAGGQ